MFKNLKKKFIQKGNIYVCHPVPNVAFNNHIDFLNNYNETATNKVIFKLGHNCIYVNGYNIKFIKAQNVENMCGLRAELIYTYDNIKVTDVFYNVVRSALTISTRFHPLRPVATLASTIFKEDSYLLDDDATLNKINEINYWCSSYRFNRNMVIKKMISNVFTSFKVKCSTFFNRY